MPEPELWKPGSFTKNFGWGPDENGLKELYDVLRLGFDGVAEDVPRSIFRKRVTVSGRPDYIPLNFFLFNKVVDDVSYVIVDELVFQALTSRHSQRFDMLALYAFNLSMAGSWKGARVGQRYPALWAKRYVSERVSREFGWNVSKVNAPDIERYVGSDVRYQAQSALKLSTNLNYLYRVGRLRNMATEKVERWWVDALFLTLDRIIEDRQIDGLFTRDEQLSDLVIRSGFFDLSGKTSLQKELASRHLIRLYAECGGRNRFSPDHVRERTAIKFPDFEWYIANDDRVQGAVHPTNPNILKTIPRACAMLAIYAGFEIIDADELATFDPKEFIKRHTQVALERLRDQGVTPTMTAEELMRLTRER